MIGIVTITHLVFGRKLGKAQSDLESLLKRIASKQTEEIKQSLREVTYESSIFPNLTPFLCNNVSWFSTC